MSSKNSQVDLEKLNAYLDGELNDAASERFEAELADDPEAQTLLSSYRHQDDALRAALASTLNEPVPARFNRLINPPPSESEPRSAEQRMPFWRGRLATAAATGVLFLAVGVFAGWNVRSNLYSEEAERMAIEMFLQQATNSYSLFAGGDSSWGSGGLRTDRNEFAEWFKTALDINITTPEFQDMSFEFVGGRALPVASRGSAGQVLYENADGEVVAIYFQVSPSDSPAAERMHRNGRAQRNGLGQANGLRPTFVERDELSVYYWRSSSGSTTYAMMGSIDKEGLTALAEAILEQFGGQE